MSGPAKRPRRSNGATDRIASFADDPALQTKRQDQSAGAKDGAGTVFYNNGSHSLTGSQKAASKASVAAGGAALARRRGPKQRTTAASTKSCVAQAADTLGIAKPSRALSQDKRTSRQTAEFINP